MRNLLSQLRKLNEELTSIDINTFAEACLNTSKFYYEGQDVKSMLEEGEEVTLQETTVETGETVYTVDYDNIYICTLETFNEIIDSCANEYRFKHINDFLEPFFNDNEYYKACKTDKVLTKLILEEDDIKEWEVGKVQEQSYVIFK